MELAFTGPAAGGTAKIDNVVLWELPENTAFISGAAISATTPLKIGGSTCPCSITIPSGTSLKNMFLVDTDTFTSPNIDNEHNWAVAVYFDPTQPTGLAVAQSSGGGQGHSGGMQGGFTSGDKTGNTTLPFGADTQERIFLVTGIEF